MKVSRLRRQRRTDAIRKLNRETLLSPDKLILPLFAISGANAEHEVESMPGVFRRSPDALARVMEKAKVSAVMLFGVVDSQLKDSSGSYALDAKNPALEAVKTIKAVRPDIALITDLCLCGYTDHGHCGVLAESGEVDNDQTLDLLGRVACEQAAAGADVVAPSAMMDFQVAAVREALDAAGYHNTSIMSYSSKFASAFYGPFRDAAASKPGKGDRSGYQLPPANAREAIRESIADEQEGADWLMVKPALPYLDIIRRLRETSLLPIAAYQVSGEYSMLKTAASHGLIDERNAVLETLVSIFRAGADSIITYYAQEAIEWMD